MAKIQGHWARSTRTHRWFQWVQYCDDGWGKYEDSIYAPDADDLPTFFARGEPLWREFRDHIHAEVEFVPVTITFGEPSP